MGRRKISIKAIGDKKIKYSTFNKRKNGLVKKAAELSMLCDVKMLLIFEDLNGEVVRYSTHGLYEPDEYFKEAWLQSDRSFTAKDYPDFFKVKQYKKVLERREKKKIKEEADSLTKQEASPLPSDEDDYSISLAKNERESKPLKEKTATAYKSKRKKSLKVKLTAKDLVKATPEPQQSASTNHNHSTRSQRTGSYSSNTPQHMAMNVKRENGTPTQTSMAYPDDTPETNFQIPQQRTPQLFGLVDMRSSELERPSPNILGLSNTDFSDMRSPGLSFLLGNNKLNRLFDDPSHFVKPNQIGNKNQYSQYGMKEETGASPRQSGIPVTPDMMQSQNHNRKSSFESYFHLLRKDSDGDVLWKKMTSPNGFKLRSPSFQPQKIDGIASYLNLNNPAQNIEMFDLEEGYKDDSQIKSHQMDNSQLNITIGHEPEKRVKKD